MVGELQVTEQWVQDFRHSLRLNIEALTWQGRYLEGFEDLWAHCFYPDSLKEIALRLRVCSDHAETGPLKSWFLWLKNRFDIFNFMHLKLSVSEFIKLYQLEVNEFSYQLQLHFRSLYPLQEDKITNFFSRDKIYFFEFKEKYSDLDELFSDPESFKDEELDDIMRSLEVTLYPEWNELLYLVYKNKRKGSRSHLIGKFFVFIRRPFYFRVARDSLFLLLFIYGLFWAIKKYNEKIIANLSQDIKTFEPEIAWTDKSFSFNRALESTDSFGGKGFDLQSLEDVLNNQRLDLVSASLYEPESDIVSNSDESKKIEDADGEVSSFEEVKSGGYRDTLGGGSVVYRLMMKSHDYSSVRDELNRLLLRFRAKKADNVDPGTMVPGGVYYNLLINEGFFQEFIDQVSRLAEVKIYKSAVREMPVKGQRKVFIWIKSV
jgi:hypothetical protein